MLYIISVQFLIIYGSIEPNHPDPDDFTLRTGPFQALIRSILLGLRRKITGLLLSGPKSSFQMKIHFAFNLEIKIPESGGRAERNRIHVA